MSFCPLESYEQDRTGAECGSPGVLLMASLLPICDVRSRAQGKCRRREDVRVTDSVSLCVYMYVYVQNSGWYLGTVQRKAKVKWRWIGHKETKEDIKEVEGRTGRTGAFWRWVIWWKGYFLSQGSSCQSYLVAFVVPPFHCDLTLSQGETRDKHSGSPSISHLTLPLSLSLSWPAFLSQADTCQPISPSCVFAETDGILQAQDSLQDLSLRKQIRGCV